MRVVVTGAAGFVASGVVEKLISEPDCLGAEITDLLLADRAQGSSSGRWITGDLSDPDHIAALLDQPVDIFLHLASIPGGKAEQEPELGRAVNLDASLALLAGLAAQHRSGGPQARVVFASTIAVMGALGPAPVNETHPVAPAISYGAHKLMAEVDIADLSRRGDIDGISLRLPGIVARPPEALAGFGSAFMSRLFHAAATGANYTCPVSRNATAWWMSRHTVVSDILHAMRMDTSGLGSDRMVLLPALFTSVDALMDGLAARYGVEAVSGIDFVPEQGIVTLFGRFPEIDNTTARALGFAMDTDVARLIENVAIPANEAAT